MMQLVVIGFLLMLVMTALQFYQAFHSPRCPAELPETSCFRPLFSAHSPVDFFVYLTVDKKLRWWTPAGLEELRKVPLWNATAVRYGEPVTSGSVFLPLSAEPLHGIRRNESTLYAHVFLVRAGKRIEDSTISDTTGRRRPERGVLSGDVVHAAAPITRWQPQVRVDYKNLLEDALVQDNRTSRDLGQGVEEDPPVLVRVPVVGWSLSVYPDGALKWVGATWLVAGFCAPSLFTVALRQVLLVAVGPWLLQLHWQQEEQRQALMQQQRLLEGKRRREDAARPVVPHLVPTVRIGLAFDTEAYHPQHRPPLLYKEMIFEPGSPMPTGERDIRYPILNGPHHGCYPPPLAVDTAWVERRAWRALDSNMSRPDPQVGVEVEVSDMIYYAVTQTLRQNIEMYMRFGFTEQDLEDLKTFLFRYPLKIMIIMQVVGFIQMLLTTLAFKNDIAFFKGRSDYTGLSSRSLATDIIHELVIFLYIYDYEHASRLILFQWGTSVAINTWKLARVARLGVFWSYFLPWVSYNRAILGGAEQETEEMDARGMKYLKYILYPLSACWGLYNLRYYLHKSWWSWLVSSMADFAYTFGFINMMPQIFINWKLKSVAHMPWRVMIYKFFHTFIDDVFAFVIMPEYMSTKHRWMTLRDDVVFFIFLFQRCVYRVDLTRANEFGYAYAESEEQQGKPQEALPALDAQADSGSTHADGTAIRRRRPAE